MSEQTKPEMCPCGWPMAMASGIGPYCTRTGRDEPCIDASTPTAMEALRSSGETPAPHEPTPYVGWSSGRGFHYSEDGAYVRRQDHDALRAENTRLRAALERFVEAEKHIRNVARAALKGDAEA